MGTGRRRRYQVGRFLQEWVGVDPTEATSPSLCSPSVVVDGASRQDSVILVVTIDRRNRLDVGLVKWPENQVACSDVKREGRQASPNNLSKAVEVCSRRGAVTAYLVCVRVRKGDVSPSLATLTSADRLNRDQP